MSRRPPGKSVMGDREGTWHQNSHGRRTGVRPSTEQTAHDKPIPRSSSWITHVLSMMDYSHLVRHSATDLPHWRGHLANKKVPQMPKSRKRHWSQDWNTKMPLSRFRTQDVQVQAVSTWISEYRRNILGGTLCRILQRDRTTVRACKKIAARTIPWKVGTNLR